MLGELLMSKRERDRMRVLERVKLGIITVKEAAPLMGISYRQALRIKGRYEKEGAVGLVHRSRGRDSNRRIDTTIKDAIVERYKERYEGFGSDRESEVLIESGVSRRSDLGRWCSWTAAFIDGLRIGPRDTAV